MILSIQTLRNRRKGTELLLRIEVFGSDGNSSTYDLREHTQSEEIRQVLDPGPAHSTSVTAQRVRLVNHFCDKHGARLAAVELIDFPAKSSRLLQHNYYLEVS